MTGTNWPSSSRVIDKKSIRILLRWFTLDFILSTCLLRSATCSVVTYLEIKAADESILLSGVLNSWDAIETNLDLSRLSSFSSVSYTHLDVYKRQAKESGADIIVIGTTGAKGLKEIFFGSVASKVIESATCPVFMVPDTANYKGILKIGLTLEYKTGEQELIEKSLAFTRRLQGHLHCLHVDVYDPEKTKVKLLEYKEAFKHQSDITFHVHYELDVEKGILEFMKFNQIDVVIMRVQHQSMLKELFSYSIARRIAYHTDIPLLALHTDKQ